MANNVNAQQKTQASFASTTGFDRDKKFYISAIPSCMHLTGFSKNFKIYDKIILPVLN